MNIINVIRREEHRVEKQINSLQDTLTALRKASNLLNGRTERTGRHRLSAAARRRISIAQKKRWREQRAKAR